MTSSLRSLSVLLLLALIPGAFAVEPTKSQPNTDPTYLALRQARSGQAYEVTNAKLVRDVGTFTFNSGTFCFLEPVQGVVTGAVFKGAGTFTIATNDRIEQKQLSTLTGQTGFSEEFERLTLRFVDATADELRASGALKESSAPCPVDVLEDTQKQLRTELHENIAARLLQPVLATKADGSFHAFIRGKKYGRVLFAIDPRGLATLAPDQVIMMTHDDMKSGLWYGGRLTSESAPKLGSHDGRFIEIASQKIDTTIEKNGMLTATATTKLNSTVDGLRVIPFDLVSKLRVSSVTDGSGAPLNWIQEDKDEDGDFFVILPKPVAKGESVTITTSYAGKEVVSREGDGNYYPTSRSNWYPNVHVGGYTHYELTFRIPKGNQIAATGLLVSERTEGNQHVSVWKTDVPIAVAGFNIGSFKREDVELPKEGVKVEAFANKEIPDMFKQLRMIADSDANTDSSALGALGTMETTPMLKRALAEAQLSVRLYTDYFGPMSYKGLQVTQQTAGWYGQAWPGLVFLPITYFLDSTTRHTLGMDDTKAYFNVVEPHEVAHEWWGHTVGWTSYRDQWMSEGFSDFSASLFLQLVRGDTKAYMKFWKDQRTELLEKNKLGRRAIDAGPVTLGYRASNFKTGYGTYGALVYAKGSYILHMLRMMMWTPQGRDTAFQNMMKDFVNTYRNKPATTEDFKAVVERHMTPQMNFAGDRKMDWFFNNYVYGTEIPKYTLDTSSEAGADGKLTYILRIQQSDVSPSFRMLVPIYYELNDGKVMRLGSVVLSGNETKTIPVSADQIKPKRFLVNYFYDVLASE